MARTKKMSGAKAAPMTTAQMLGSLLKSARDIMRKDKGLNGDLDRLPLLTWIMFLKFLDDLEQQGEEEAALSGKKFKAAIEAPYRWRDWAADPQGITGDELLAFINNDEAVRPDGRKGPGLFAYLRALSSSNGDNRRDVIATVFKGVDNRMRSGYLLRDVINKVGSTNYAAIRPNDVLGYEIPLPPLDEQHRIVARIEELAAKVAEAQNLRALCEQAAVAFVAATHAALATSKPEPLSSFIELCEDTTPIEIGVPYPQVGVRGFGGGLFAKPPVHGGETTYRAFNRLCQGALVMSQVKGWEGAIAVTPQELHGYFVSPEYRTFRCKADRCLPDYLAALVPTEFFWGRLKDATRGVGARRERTRPEQFLQLEFSMPSIKDQEQAVATFASMKAVKDLQRETATGIDVMLPAILDKAFHGEF